MAHLGPSLSSRCDGSRFLAGRRGLRRDVTVGLLIF